VSRDWQFRPRNGREVVILVVGAILVAIAATVSIIGLVRFFGQLTGH